MLGGGITGADADKKKDLGLIVGHAYSVLACAEVYSSQG